MSDVLYPLNGFLRRVTITPYTRTLVDRFEDGSQQRRRLWPVKSFKRRFAVEHSPLTAEEFDYLQGFYTDRTGEFDSFWFRNNVERSGQHEVVFGGPVPRTIDAAVLRQLRAELVETSVTRELPTFSQLKAALGATPALWLDAHRESFYQWKGVDYTEAALHNATRATGYTMTNTGIVFQGVNSGTFTRENSYKFAGGDYAVSTEATAFPPSLDLGVGGTHFGPALTIFGFFKNATSAATQVLAGASNFGLALNSSNNYVPWIGGGGTWSGAVQSNGTANTWRSIAVTWAAANPTARLYVNGALVGSDSNAGTYGSGSTDKLTLGALADGTNSVQSGFASNVIIANAQYSLAQIKALHNLFAFEHGVAEVS